MLWFPRLRYLHRREQRLPSALFHTLVPLVHAKFRVHIRRRGHMSAMGPSCLLKAVFPKVVQRLLFTTTVCVTVICYGPSAHPFSVICVSNFTSGRLGFVLRNESLGIWVAPEVLCYLQSSRFIFSAEEAVKLGNNLSARFMSLSRFRACFEDIKIC